MRECLTAIVSFIRRYPKDAAIIALLLVVVWQSWRPRVEKNKVQSPTMPQAMPSDTKQIVTVYRDRVITKWRDGPTKVEYRDQYLPPEGHVEVIAKKDQPNALPEMKLKDHGFTFRPGGGMVYSERFLLEADTKFAYWRRYGLVVNFTTDFAGLGATRHVDDFIPILNLEVLGNVGVSWRGDLRFGFGVRTNF